MSKKAKIAKLKEQNRQLRRQIRISHPGSLKDLGFNLHESISREKAAIERADEKYGRPETDRKLAALEVLDPSFFLSGTLSVFFFSGSGSGGRFSCSGLVNTFFIPASDRFFLGFFSGSCCLPGSAGLPFIGGSSDFFSSGVLSSLMISPALFPSCGTGSGTLLS